MHNETMARNNRRCLAGQQCFFAYFIKNLANINITKRFYIEITDRNTCGTRICVN